MRTHSLVLLAAVLCGCSRKVVGDPGPPPGADHQAQVRAMMNRLLKDDGTARYRFAAPVHDRLPRYLFEPDVPGQPHKFGYIHGWRVDVWATAKNTYERGETPYMAFIRDGQLKGIFTENRARNAPMDLDKWAPLHVLPAVPR